MTAKKKVRVIIAGSRFYNNYDRLKRWCDHILKDFNVAEIVSGCAKGADKLGERYAQEKGYKVTKFFPDWKSQGKVAGPLGNKKMAENADVLILFWDTKSKGSKSMKEIAEKMKLHIFEVIIR